jgi:hypothetical protein
MSRDVWQRLGRITDRRPIRRPPAAEPMS